MRKQILVFILFLLGCQNKENSPFLSFGGVYDEVPRLEFQYGEVEDAGDIIENTNYTSFESGLLCIHSLPLSLYDRELGGKFRICWKTNEHISEKWNQGFSLLEEEPKEYPSWEIKGNGWKAVALEYGKWKKDSEALNKVLQWERQIWSSGLVTYQTFGLPHPTFIQRTSEVCEILFPSHRLMGSENKQLVLSFELGCPDLGEIAERIESQNENWFSHCDPTEPVVSELFRHSESSYQRWIEWENPKDSVLCPKDPTIDLEIGGEWKSFQSDLFAKRSKIILPHGILLFSDDQRYQGIPIPKEFLSGLGTDAQVRFGNSEFRDSHFSFRQGNEFFSSQVRSLSCRNQYNLWKAKDLFCGNPGLPNLLQTKERDGDIPSCQTDQIHITEFYPGNHFDSEMPIPGFFEFQNLGRTCDGSSLNWVFDHSIYPLSADEWILPSGSIFVLTRKLWSGLEILEKEKPFSLPKFVFQIPNFFWEDRKDKTKTEFLSSPDQFHLLRFQEKNRHSIQITSGNQSPHPFFGSSPFLSAYGFHLSPGTVNESLVVNASTELLEYNPNQFPFLDFGFWDPEEGVVRFERENGKTYSFWKPKGSQIITLAGQSSLCNGDRIYRLPEDFFSEPFLSLRYKNHLSENLTLNFNPSLVREKSLGGTRSLHPEPAPILFSRSLVPSSSCPSDFRSPGVSKLRSLEVERLALPYHYTTNFPLENQTGIYLGNGSNKIQINLQRLGDASYTVDSGSPLPFFPEEQIYSYFNHPQLIQPKSFLEQKGPVQIEAIYPNPHESQNEWIYLCNRGTNSEDLSVYLVEDEVSTDELVSYQTRFLGKYPLGAGGQRFESNSTILNPNGCAWIVDPDGKDWFLPIFQRESDLLLTVKSTATIGNGIASGESIQLRKKQNQGSLLISSFGHKESHSPIRIPVTTGEFLWLKQGVTGMKAADYEIFREGL
ncbi:LIC11755 family lipoprotein [Leptospira brenneri]|uniref:Lamin tail domain-containing protein n=1 Tax=Leptospira brenneri TaxID=2023182 RepID=A0A2M9Y1V7_9LEPT|nr:lamin tail domain-containing protein [Leptospira brenneri]PJZ45562.1 hypothetical protein CH361_11110 [Leptospira brenneri]TGK92054.1 lamin tail domain-containing protein [Leptospira brenneri]